MNIINYLKDWNHSYLLIVLGILIVTVVLSKLAARIVNRTILSASEGSKIAPTHHHFFKNALTLILWSLALMTMIFIVPQFRAVAITLFASAGVFIAILGLAAQQALSNIASGIFIVIFKPFRIGDFITIADKYTGIVEDITLRHTIITNFENRRVIIPNSIISSETVLNSSISDQKTREAAIFEISYESEIDLALHIIMEEAKKHRYCIDNRTDLEKKQNQDIVQGFVSGFGDSSVILKAFIWCADPNKARDLHHAINQSVKERFDREGIEIPYPHRTLVHKKLRTRN